MKPHKIIHIRKKENRLARVAKRNKRTIYTDTVLTAFMLIGLGVSSLVAASAIADAATPDTVTEVTAVDSCPSKT